MKCRIGIAMLLALALGVTKTNAQSMGNDTIDYFNMSLEDLMNMEIVAVSKKAENSFDAPLSSSIITKEEIINSGATTIEEAFRLVPGFIVREETNGNYDIHIRGNDNIPSGNFTFFTENSMSLIMVDGRKVFNNMNGGTFWESLPVSLTDVERIEIIRGASTALYGPNAVNGVVNIITKKAQDKPFSIDGNLMTGTASSTIGDFAINNSFADNKLKTRISANFEKRDRHTEDYYNWVNGSYVPYTDLVYYMDADPTNPAGNTTLGANHPTYENPELAKDKYGVNAWLSYKASKKVDFNLSAGLQNSTAQTVFMEGLTTPITSRESESYYVNTISNIHGISLQFSGNFGTQDVYKGSGISSKYDYNNIDAILEYDWTLGDLTLRPGVSYQRVAYDDSEYLPTPESKRGFINGEAVLSNFAYYLRGDYKATKKLRLIAALRMDHYNKPKDNYFTYQLIGTYKPNDNNLLRASFSKANRGPVIVDFFTNYEEGSPTSGQFIQYLGNEDMNLSTSNVIELGYRSQLSKQLQIDIEGFYSTTDNFSTFEPTIVGSPTDANNPLPYLHLAYNYQNASVKATQTGLTASVFYAPSTKLQLKAFGTVQKTELEDQSVREVPMMILPESGIFENPQYKLVDQTHKHTPGFFGGMTANYRPIEKLNVFVGMNYYSKQTYTHDYAFSQYHFLTDQGSGVAEVKANTTVNAKVSYKIYKNSSIFVNARNLFNSKERQFGFADEMAGLYLVGFNVSL
ncbi:TonB-dependent receptor [Carboxylicivirga sp. A043]|uniref:TonB-dependent receptor plug domain-containing protein n=1 Tax=Carboxylicivirga litoralis TaxID=2816963 RepID=UPI002916E437|nr:TonB-dependent receptor [Carboxylicivirga sp. A043]MCU4157618.1 TonB-dependent receptor [Carboxylicivirga sp. A043]